MYFYVLGYVPYDDDTSYIDGNYTTTWCLQNYGATDCAQIRDEAIDRAVLWGGKVIASQSTVGIVCLLIIGWSMYTSYQILTPPVITESMLDMINYLLLLPVAGCVALSIYFWWLLSIEGLDESYLPVLFLSLALAQIIALPLGITSGRMKSRPLLIVYIVLMVFIALGFAATGAVGWTLASTIQQYRPNK